MRLIAESLRQPPAGKRINASAQVALTKDLRRMFADMSRRLETMLILEAGEDDKIDLKEAEAIKIRTRQIVESYFINPTAYDRSGVRPLAAYPRILNKYYIRVVVKNIQAHQDWLRKNLPADIYAWMTAATLPDNLPQQEAITPRQALVKMDPLRQWVPMHRWTDPNGYRLSDRIWNTSDATRQAIDRIITEGLRTGQGSKEMAKKLARFLNPDAAKVKTYKPYGQRAYFSAMRLARTEITRAHNQAAVLAGRINPFVDRMDIARSTNGDKSCRVCPIHATIDMKGDRVREPYPVDEVEAGPFHPHCMCNCRPVVMDDTAAAMDEFVAMRNRAEPAPVTPAMGERLLRWLLGSYLFQQWLSEDEAA